MPRRKPGSLLPLEVSILSVCLDSGEQGIHGFAIAKGIAATGDTRELTATGTLYRALHRLDESGLLESWWEDPDEAAEAGRPRRRCYRVSHAGAAAVAAAHAPSPATATRLDPRLIT